MTPADIRKLADDNERTGYWDMRTAALYALADVVEAANEEHGKRDREPECNLCQALARLEAL